MVMLDVEGIISRRMEDDLDETSGEPWVVIDHGHIQKCLPTKEDMTIMATNHDKALMVVG